MPGARCARSLVCEMKKHTSIVATVTPETSGIPRAMVYSLYRALPGDRAFLSPSPVKVAFHRLDAGVEASGPHDFAVRRTALSSAAPPTSTASRLAFVTIASRPSEEAGRGELVKMICPTAKAKYFFSYDWTGSIRLIRFMKFGFRRKGFPSPLPLAGEADARSAAGGGRSLRSNSVFCGGAPTPALPRERERERTSVAATNSI
jgi:hypothetical protein